MRIAFESQQEYDSTVKAVLAALKAEVERGGEMSPQRVAALAEAVKAL